MRTLLLIFVVMVTGIILLATLAPIITLVLTLAILYYAIRRFILAQSFGSKLGWAIVSLIGLSLSISNSAAFVGIVACVLLYYTYRCWKKPVEYEKTDDWIME